MTVFRVLSEWALKILQIDSDEFFEGNVVHSSITPKSTVNVKCTKEGGRVKNISDNHLFRILIP
jgi:hypothetical protein